MEVLFLLYFTTPCWPAALLTLVIVLYRRRQSSYPFRASFKKYGYRVLLLVVVVAWILGLAKSIELMLNIHVDF